MQCNALAGGQESISSAVDLQLLLAYWRLPGSAISASCHCALPAIACRSSLFTRSASCPSVMSLPGAGPAVRFMHSADGWSGQVPSAHGCCVSRLGHIPVQTLPQLA